MTVAAHGGRNRSLEHLACECGCPWRSEQVIRAHGMSVVAHGGQSRSLENLELEISGCCPGFCSWESNWGLLQNQ